MPTPDLAVILGACRTPIGTFGGALKSVSASALGALVIRDAIRRAAVQSDAIDDVVLGCVLQAGAGMNVARQATLQAGLAESVPAETVNRVCGSGLQAVAHAVEALHLGYAQVVVAGGTESMSNAPYFLTGARWGLRMGHGEVRDSLLAEGLTCAIAGCHMGITAEEVAAKYGITRAEQDAFAAESQRRAADAIAGGLFDEELVPVPTPTKENPSQHLTRDEHPRPGTTEAKLGALRPAFAAQGSVTAGNASGINDGASAMIVTSARTAADIQAVPLGRIVSFAVAGVSPRLMGLGPIPAAQKALERAAMTTRDIDLWELNEAFAAQSLAVVRELGLPPDRVNVRGGAIALGHPLGASGARVLTTLLHALRARGGGTGVAALCIGGGMGIAMVVRV